MNSKKTILISWAISLAFIIYIVALCVAPLRWFPFIITVRLVPFLMLLMYDIIKRNCDHGIITYLLIPHGTLLLVVRDFKTDFRTVFKR